VQHLALRDQVLHRARHVLHRHLGVHAVLVEQVDAVGAQALQEASQTGADALRPAVLALGGIALLEAELGGDDDLVAHRRQRFADQLLVREGAVGLGGVEEGDAALVMPRGSFRSPAAFPAACRSRSSAPCSRSAKSLVRHVLPGFLAAYPDIHVEFVVDTRLVDIVADGFDAGIRVLQDVPRDMIAIRFGADMRFIAVASPEYLVSRELPKEPHDLARHRCIRFRFESGALYRWDLEHQGKSASVDVDGPMTLGNLNLMVEAALGGIGVAWVPEYLVEELLVSGRLIQLLPEWCPSFPGLCLYYPANRHPPAALKLFADAVRDWANRR
jgi:DNA-binding transcriptional LysR family regulator